MIIFERFKGGEMIISSLKMKFLFQSKDILFIRGMDLIYFIIKWNPMDGGE
jgi:hypothetical protein